MHAQAVDVFDIARANAGRKRDVGEGGHAVSSSWPGIAVRRTASFPLAYVPAIHVSLCDSCKDVDARHKAGHDGKKSQHRRVGRAKRAQLLIREKNLPASSRP